VVVDAWGSIVAEAGDDDGLLEVDLDPADIARAREVNPSLANRRW
jgi:predicted amidohydrolase